MIVGLFMTLKVNFIEGLLCYIVNFYVDRCSSMKIFFSFFLSLLIPLTVHSDNSDSNLSLKIAELENELAHLKQKVEKLEAILKPMGQSKPIVVDRFGWQIQANWKKVVRCMSRQQVQAILGRPTRIRKPYSTMDDVDLIFEGQKSGSGFISGNIRINELNKVTSISPPVFDIN